MAMRILLMAMLAALAAPAMAQPCKITRTDKGLTTIASVKINGVKATDLILDTGPFFATLKLDADAKAKGYALLGEPKLPINAFRYGYSVDDKDWRTPGSVRGDQGGFAFAWPRLQLDGKPVDRVTIEIRSGEEMDRFTFKKESRSKSKGMGFLWSDSPSDLHGFYVPSYGEDEYDAYDIWLDWQYELDKRQPVTVTFTDYDAKQVVASLIYTPVTFEGAQERMVSDVNALRKAFADGKCEAS